MCIRDRSLTGLATTVLPSTLYTFNLVYTPGASEKYWGLDIKASTGTLAAATGMKKSGSEVTHSAPMGGTTATSYTYTGIKWTSPATVGSVITFSFACVGNTVTNTSSGARWQLGTFSTTVVLPVEFVGFNIANVGDNKVNINWKTATEINTVPVSYTHLDVYKRQENNCS